MDCVSNGVRAVSTLCIQAICYRREFRSHEMVSRLRTASTLVVNHVVSFDISYSADKEDTGNVVVGANYGTTASHVQFDDLPGHQYLDFITARTRWGERNACFIQEFQQHCRAWIYERQKRRDRGRPPGSEAQSQPVPPGAVGSWVGDWEACHEPEDCRFVHQFPGESLRPGGDVRDEHGRFA